MWYIYDENGVPLGKVKLPEGVSIEDYDVAGNLIPLGVIPSRPNPQTGDNFSVFLFILALAVLGSIAAVAWKMSRKKHV